MDGGGGLGGAGHGQRADEGGAEGDERGQGAGQRTVGHGRTSTGMVVEPDDRARGQGEWLLLVGNPSETFRSMEQMEGDRSTAGVEQGPS
ncbi:hypothetical protein Jiend_46410 [Micromonospora endophytica]|nr:hypothetical protein Jiend_46410 [Micromonospora endophytica]